VKDDAVLLLYVRLATFVPLLFRLAPDDDEPDAFFGVEPLLVLLLTGRPVPLRDVLRDEPPEDALFDLAPVDAVFVLVLLFEFPEDLDEVDLLVPDDLDEPLDLRPGEDEDDAFFGPPDERVPSPFPERDDVLFPAVDLPVLRDADDRP
jgi:hypothetical protein